MRSNRLRGCLVVAALFTASSSALAQGTDDKPATEDAPQEQPSPQGPEQPTSSGPTTPGARELPPEEELRKMVEEQVAKSRPKGPAIEFAGYARAGVGLAVRGGKQVCFGLGGADAKWRLGNECDYVIEPQFTGKLVQRDDGSNWGVVVMPGLYRTFEDPNGADRTFFDNLPANFRQIYFYGENIPQLLNGRVWGGRRYYDRLQLGINDHFLENEDSDGAGIESMNVGPGKLSVAFLMNPNSEASQVPNVDPGMGELATISSANLAPFKLTARFTDVKTMPEGALQFWTAFSGAATSDDQSGGNDDPPDVESRFRFAVYHTLNKVLNGSNLIGAKIEYGENFLLWRAAVDQNSVINAGRTGVSAIAEFRSVRTRLNSNTDWVTNNWFQVGARVDHQIKGPFRFLAEAGIDRIMPDGGDALQLVKATGAFAINAGDGPGSRPTIRLFYTHGFWNDAAKGDGGVYDLGQSGNRLNQVYGDKNNGGSVGIQAEAWW